MKLIHCADLHIGSRMDSKYPPQKAQIRRQELRNAFVSLVEEAENIGASAILIAGDAFDSDHPGEKDLDYFYGVIASHPNISFFYLRGNHDIDGYGPNDALENLFLFSQEEWVSYSYDDEHVTISGIEITKDNKDNLFDMPGLERDSKNFNIAMLHGQVGSDINLKSLAHHNINYWALGHVHSFKIYDIEDKGIAIYPGILEPRGFDELGKKGFVVIDTDTRQHYFQPFNRRTVHWETLDVTDMQSEFEISNAIRTLITNASDIYRVELVGTKNLDLRLDLENIVSRYRNNCFLLNIIDGTKKPNVAEELDLDTPLVKEFVSKMMTDGSLTIDERAEAIQTGLNALSGKEF